MRCSLCGFHVTEYPAGTGVVLNSYVGCLPCLETLIEGEIEDRGEREESRRFAEYHSGSPTAEDRERQDLKDAGRIP